MKINASNAAKVVLPVKATAIRKTVRVGDNLEIHLTNGNVITLENYFPNKPALLTNEANQTVAEFMINDDGAIVGIKELSADESASLLGNAYSSLSTQPNDILLLTANHTNAAAVAGAKSYAVEALAASAAIVAGFFIAADRDDSSSNGGNANAQQGTSSVSQDGNSVSGKTKPGSTVTVKDSNGNVLATGQADKNGNYNVTLPSPNTNGETLVVEIKDPAGNTTTTTIKAPDTTPPTTPSDENGSVNGQGELELKDQQPGSKVVVKDPKGNVIGQGEVDQNGNAVIPLNPAPNNGEALQVEVTDPAGNTATGTITAPDTTAPDAPTGVTVSDDGLTVSGKGEPGSTVTVRDKDGNVLGTAKADEQGNFNVTVNPAQTNGEQLTVTATDAKGNESATTQVTAPDTTAPDAPTGVTVADDGLTVSGKGEPGSTVTVKDKDGNVLGTAKADAQGNFNVTVNPAQTNGEQLAVTATDAKGNESATTQVTAPDTTAPDAPTGITVADDGLSVSGKGEAGSTVTVTDKDGNELGKAKADAQGNFKVAITPAQTNGEKLAVTATDAKNNESAKAEVTAPDSTAPATPEATLDDNGVLLTGTAEPGSTVKVKSPDGKVIVEATADPVTGKFELTLPPSTTKNIEITATDAAGNESKPQAMELPDLSEPATAFYVEGNKIYTYFDTNHDGTVDRAEVTTYDKQVEVDPKTGKVINAAKPTEITSYLEPSDIAGGNGTLEAVRGGQKLAVTNPDQKEYIVYTPEGNVKQRLYDLDAKTGTGQSVQAADGKTYPGIDKYETVEQVKALDTPITVDGKEVTELPLVVAYNNDAKGVDDAKAYFQYNDKGLKTYAFFDDNGDNVIDRAEHYIYDENSDNPNPIKIEYDSDASNVVNKDNPSKGLSHEGKGYDKVEYYAYEELTTTVEGKPVIEYINTAKYTNLDNKPTGESPKDSEGNIIEINGEKLIGIDTIEKNTFNDYGRKTKIEYDNNADGTADKIHYQIFDSLGRVSSVLVDSDANETTGGTALDNEGTQVKGIDSIQEIQHSRGEKLEIKENKTGDGDQVSTVYNVLDVYGRVVASYTNNDHDDSTGETLKVMVDGKEIELKGIDSFETYQYNANGHLTEILRNLDAKGNAEEKIYVERDATGNELGRYTDLDNNANTGMGNAGQDKAITLADGRVLKGVDRFETYTNDEKGNRIEIKRNLDAKGGVEEIEYRDVDKATGQVNGVYYNRDNDSKDNVPLAQKTGEKVTLTDGREVEGIDNYTTYVRDNQNRVIEERFNLDAKGADDRVYYYDLDANGNRIGEYQNLDNDTTKTLDGKDQITGTTHTLQDGREVVGIERYYTREFDSGNNMIKLVSNLDGKDHAESVSYYVRDALGREVARYDNTNNDVLSNGTPNPTGHTHTIILDGKEVEVTGIDRIVKKELTPYGNVEKELTNNTGEAGDDKFTHTTTNVYNERRQKVEDESTIKLESGETVKSAANKYTYDTYNRVATREFDSNTENEGAEKVENYTYDSYGRVVRTEYNNLITKTTSYDTNERDQFGQNLKTTTYDANNNVTEMTQYDYNLYGRTAKRYFLTQDGDVDWVREYTYNAQGQSIREYDDRNVIGKWDKGDVIKEFTRSDDAVGLIVGRKQTDNVDPIELVRHFVITYDEFNRQVLDFEDKDVNGKISVGEHYNQRIYEGTNTVANTFHYKTGAEGEDVLRYTVQINRDEKELTISRFVSNNKGEFETLHYDGWGAPQSSTEDYTTEKFQTLFDKFGGKLKTLNLSNETQSTEITFDNDTLAKMTAGRLVINGDKTDTINLKDSAEFSKQEAMVKEGANDYVQYTTEVGGDTYTLLIDTDVNVNLL